jgi:hypothetical protein
MRVKSYRPFGYSREIIWKKKRGRPFGTHKISLKSTLKETLRAKSDDEGDMEVSVLCV